MPVDRGQKNTDTLDETLPKVIEHFAEVPHNHEGVRKRIQAATVYVAVSHDKETVGRKWQGCFS